MQQPQTTTTYYPPSQGSHQQQAQQYYPTSQSGSHPVVQQQPPTTTQQYYTSGSQHGSRQGSVMGGQPMVTSTAAAGTTSYQPMTQQPMTQQPMMQQHAATVSDAQPTGSVMAREMPAHTHMVQLPTDPNLYAPSNATYVATGTPLRGGMTPIYSPHEVRTFEAAPIFSQQSMAGQMQTRDVPMDEQSHRSSAAGSTMSQTGTKPLTQPQKRRMMCC